MLLSPSFWWGTSWAMRFSSFKVTLRHTCLVLLLAPLSLGHCLLSFSPALTCMSTMFLVTLPPDQPAPSQAELLTWNTWAWWLPCHHVTWRSEILLFQSRAENESHARPHCQPSCPWVQLLQRPRFHWGPGILLLNVYPPLPRLLQTGIVGRECSVVGRSMSFTVRYPKWNPNSVNSCYVSSSKLLPPLCLNFIWKMRTIVRPPGKDFEGLLFN